MYAEGVEKKDRITEGVFAIIATKLYSLMENLKSMNKYRNREVIVDGLRFQSVKEASRWQELRMLERAGEITGLVRQQKIELIPKTKLYRACYYVCDFIYDDKRENKTIYEDVKGVRTKEYLLKRKLLYWRHGIEIKET